MKFFEAQAEYLLLLLVLFLVSFSYFFFTSVQTQMPIISSKKDEVIESLQSTVVPSQKDEGKSSASQSPQPLHSCSVCAKTDCALRCSKCFGAFYCSVDCQKKDWKTHKPVCTRAQKTIKLWEKDAGRSFTVAEHDEMNKRDILLAGVGSATSQFNRGVALENGIGVPVDKVQAFSFYKKAAVQGCAQAQYNVGLAYKLGNGVAIDLKASLSWFKKSAEQGFAQSQFNVGCFYAEGILGSVDRIEAVKWWRRSAESGLAEGQHNLAKAYFDGAGVVKDRAQSIKWYRKAVENGYVASRFWLGFALLFKGDVIERMEGLERIYLLADAGDELAINLKASLFS